MAAVDHALLRLAKDAEDTASGLGVFRDKLPRSAAAITSAIGKLFSISALLRRIDGAQNDPRAQPSIYRIHEDLGRLFGSLHASLEQIFRMFGRSGERPFTTVWEDLNHHFDQDEGVSLVERLDLYHEFLRSQLDVLDGYRSLGQGEIRRRIVALSTAQNIVSGPVDPWAIGIATGSASRRRRPPLARIETPISRTTTLSDEWDYNGTLQPPPAPEPFSPLSPTFTSISSPTLSSSQTSYSNDPAHVSAELVHWARNVFDGSNPRNLIPATQQMDDQSACYGTIDNSALHHLGRDGFIRALELPFDREQLWMRLYWRPSDFRARILIMTKDSHRQDTHYCTALTNLKIIRNGSCLQLCRARRDGIYRMWAKLNFVFYDRMVLFYSTLVAMKHQDLRGISSHFLIDEFELASRPSATSPQTHLPGEDEIFGGEIIDGSLHHALRLWRDSTSGVVRLEACALRGPMQDVPLWTAFVTRYVGDPDWAHLEPIRRGDTSAVVHIAAFKPPPYVFLSGYQPLRNDAHDWILHFALVDDAKQFIEQWTALCNRYS
ncbi:Hypothetical protein R9X50_00576800 [Acrodontium crateriforme]|uniref:Uncharacterized protein n=1 Tax=Acrodontium crateriforme TaxID=150365 RepID=A0AAQ3M8M1_9PEZI|nr:Hypothetical protein R9X50_00576800 [Acrodontium crateriforme]